MPKVSVIIPVYCVEKYIERCARSLFEQTLDDIEYLFIDDCTPDRSIDILKQVLEEYPQRKPQVTIQRMEHNSGQARVREWGIRNATGEYIIHCDSDDWVDINSYCVMYDKAKAEGADMVFIDFDRTDGIHHKHVHRNIPKDKKKLLSGLISGNIMGSLWGCLCRKEIYDCVEVFPKYNFIEDLVLSIQLVLNSSNFEYIDNPYYKYYKNQDSITSHGDKEKTIKIFEHSQGNYEIIYKLLERNNLSSIYTEEIVAMQCSHLHTLSPFVNDKHVRRLWKKTYGDLLVSVLRNRYVKPLLKIKYLLTRFKVYPYLMNIKLYS